MFSVGDRVLHPLHGAGTIVSVSIRKNGSCPQRCYTMRLADDALLSIPVACEKRIGLRPVCSAQTAQQILQGKLGALPPQPANWNSRYRENMARIRSGDIHQVAQVVVCLRQRSRRRALAGSEKRMLECAEHILYSELMLVTGMRQKEIEKSLQSQYGRMRQ